ncbi:hypothetical protein OG558_19735 [Kribbella sp. NBC_01510]|uniref:hypothetical protein n=1 Tax=Kribbella sp. NBC_01510 TaxID=2903581 RepID=UPI003865EC52
MSYPADSGDTAENDEVVPSRSPCAKCGSTLERHWCIPTDDRSEAEKLFYSERDE